MDKNQKENLDTVMIGGILKKIKELEERIKEIEEVLNDKRKQT
jgi:ABC-type Fe3+-citrate transport system substrate-binding protein